MCTAFGLGGGLWGADGASTRVSLQLRAGPVGPRGRARPGRTAARRLRPRATWSDLRRRQRQRAARRPGPPVPRAVDDRQQVEGLRQRVTAVASLGHDLNGRLGPEQGRRGRPGETPAGAAVVLAGPADRGDAHPHPVEAGLRHRGVARMCEGLRIDRKPPRSAACRRTRFPSCGGAVRESTPLSGEKMVL